MIIGFDGSRAFTDKKTGTENYSYQLLKALAKIDRNNKYIVYLRPNSVIPSVVEGSQDLKRQNLEILRCSQNDNNNWLASLRGRSGPENFQFKVINWPRLWTQGGLALQTFIDKLDVLFVPSHTLPIIRKPGLKTVVTVHDLGSEYLPGMHQLKQRLYLGLMQKYQLKTASKIIAVSNATKQDLIKKIDLNPKKIEVIHESYDKSLYRKLSNDIIVDRLRQYNLRPQEYFLFVGTVQPRKNLERVIRAFGRVIPASERGACCKVEGSQDLKRQNLEILRCSQNDNVKLVIAGSKGWLSDEIYKLPKKLGIENQVKFLGYVPDEDLPALYGGAIAFVYPSLFEGFGLPILEAQACGCPVITSNVSSMPEVSTSPRLRGVSAILVDPYSVEEIAEAMERVKDEAKRGKLVKAGLENVKRFSWEKCARETLAALA